MPKYKFVYEPNAPVGNEFSEIWGQECQIYRDGLLCPACELRMYHYYTGTVLQELHVWTGRVVIMSWAARLTHFEKMLNASTVVFHSDYTLNDLQSLSPENIWYQEFVKKIEGKLHG